MRFATANRLCFQHSTQKAAGQLMRLLAAISVAWTGAAGQAAIFDARGSSNANWNNPANWVGDVLPTSGSPKLEVRLSNTSGSSFTSNQNLASPFVLQTLYGGYSALAGGFTHNIVNGSALAFSNLGAAPSIFTGDLITSPDLTINASLILNHDLAVAVASFAGSAANLNLNGAISGPGGLVAGLNGGGNVRLGGTTANTYAGLTMINSGLLFLNKLPSVTAVPGDLVLNPPSGTRSRPAEVHLMNDNQIAMTSTVTVKGGTTLFVEGGNQTLANVEMSGANSPFLNHNGGNVVIGPSRKLSITGNITRTGHGDSIVSGGTIDLAGGVCTIHVDPPANPSFSLSSLTVSSGIANGSVLITGEGPLFLNGDMLFDIKNGGVSNRVFGSGPVGLNGTFRIATPFLSDVSGTWNLLDVVNLDEDFGPNFDMRFADGTPLTRDGRIFKSGRLEFSMDDGNLTLAAPEPAASLIAIIGSVFAGLTWRRCGQSLA